jgi:hypothetical protein
MTTRSSEMQAHFDVHFGFFMRDLISDRLNTLSWCSVYIQSGSCIQKVKRDANVQADARHNPSRLSLEVPPVCSLRKESAFTKIRISENFYSSLSLSLSLSLISEKDSCPHLNSLAAVRRQIPHPRRSRRRTKPSRARKRSSAHGEFRSEPLIFPH